jgi:hypothetical protein
MRPAQLRLVQYTEHYAKRRGNRVDPQVCVIRILAPIVGVRRKKDKEAERDITKQNERVLLGFPTSRAADLPR